MKIPLDVKLFCVVLFVFWFCFCFAGKGVFETHTPDKVIVAVFYGAQGGTQHLECAGKHQSTELHSRPLRPI